MKLHLIALAVATTQAAAAQGASGDLSTIELRSSPGLPIAAITYDGVTLNVPQHCRTSTCNALNDFRRQQLTDNANFADTIQGVSDQASRNTAAVETLSKATLTSFDESARKMETLKKALHAETQDIRGTLAQDVTALSNAIKKKTFYVYYIGG